MMNYVVRITDVIKAVTVLLIDNTDYVSIMATIFDNINTLLFVKIS